MTVALRVAACAWAAAWLCSCQAADAACEVQSASAALTNGSARAEYLKLESVEETAVADIRINPDTAAEGRCTGALIGARTVLTAKHCTGGSMFAELLVSFGPASDGQVFETSAEIAALHPDSDVMVLTLSDSPVGAIDIAPLPIAVELPEGFESGSLAQLAGYGEDASGALGQRTFLVETVLDVTDDAVAVSTGGLSGACFGDSGGPLLLRAGDGRASIAGVLRRGSVSCFGRDSYTRVDTLGDWLSQWADDADVVIEHDALGAAGRCFDELAVWLEAGELRSSLCEGDRACGWSAVAGGYRCVDASSDPCSGVSDVGQCEGGEGTRCVDGRIERSSCASCGFTCVRSPTTGSPACASSVRIQKPAHGTRSRSTTRPMTSSIRAARPCSSSKRARIPVRAKTDPASREQSA